MASALALALTGLALVGQTLLAAVSARFFRIRMKTRWGWVAYTLLLTPLLLTVTTILLGLVIPPVFDGAVLLLAVFVGVPLALGFTIDLLYVPPPEEYDLPEPSEG